MPWKSWIKRTFLAAAGLAATTLGVVGASGPISVGELNYNDPFDVDLEFIELVNTGSSNFVLTGAHFTTGITYTFSTSTVLAPSERIVVVRHRDKFSTRYGTVGIRRAAGAFTGKFADEGEVVTLVDAANNTLFEFTYSPSGAWPGRADGKGSTLECIDPKGDLNDPKNWRPSAEYLGSPGREGVGPQRVVVINEVLAHTDPPLEDAIELLNLTDRTVVLDGWWISNERAQPRKFRIPAKTSLPPHERMVIYEYQFDPVVPPTGQVGFRFNSAHGDEAVLMSTDALGNPVLWMDAVSFEATANGVSVGRYPDGTGPFTTLSHLTFGTEVTAGYPPEFLNLFRTGRGATNADPLIGPVVFSRIQYNPPIGGDEFIELQNNSIQSVVLFDPEHPENTWHLRGAVDFDFPQHVVIESGAKALVVGLSPATFRAKYQIPADIPIFGPWTNGLSNFGDHLALYKPDPPQLPPHPDAGFVPYVPVEVVDYSPNPPWPTAPNGTGPALRRKDLHRLANDPSAWEAEDLSPPQAPNLSAQAVGTGVRLSFLSQSGRTYRLEGKASLNGAWTDLGVVPTPAAGGTALVDLNSGPGFFRVVVQ